MRSVSFGVMAVNTVLDNRTALEEHERLMKDEQFIQALKNFQKSNGLRATGLLD